VKAIYTVAGVCANNARDLCHFARAIAKALEKHVTDKIPISFQISRNRAFREFSF